MNTLNSLSKNSGAKHRLSPPFMAVGSSYFIESKIANFTLLLPVEYWYYMIWISGAATVAALVVIIVAPPSRLEKFIATKLSRGNKSFIVYQAVGYLALTIVLLFVCSRLYQYRLYKRISGG
jgi:hypothetical protein